MYALVQSKRGPASGLLVLANHFLCLSLCVTSIPTALGSLGLVSNHNLIERWPPPRLDTTNLLKSCNDLADIEHHLLDVRGECAPSHEAPASRPLSGLWPLPVFFP